MGRWTLSNVTELHVQGLAQFHLSHPWHSSACLTPGADGVEFCTGLKFYLTNAPHLFSFCCLDCLDYSLCWCSIAAAVEKLPQI
jgi:hypothetical protein